MGLDSLIAIFKILNIGCRVGETLRSLTTTHVNKFETDGGQDDIEDTQRVLYLQGFKDVELPSPKK